MTRVEILGIINGIIEEEHGIKLTEDNLLIDCNIDSFGYAMLWLGIEAKLDEMYGIERLLGKEYIDNLDYEKLTVKELIDGITCRLAKCI